MLGTFARSRHVKSAHVPQNLFTRGRERKIEREGRRNVVDGRHPARSSAVTKARRRRSSISRATTIIGRRASGKGRAGREARQRKYEVSVLFNSHTAALLRSRTAREGGKGAAEATARECVVWRNRETHETDVRDSRKRKRGKERARARKTLLTRLNGYVVSGRAREHSKRSVARITRSAPRQQRQRCSGGGGDGVDEDNDDDVDVD